jgi:hypothetical protein
MAKRAIGVVKLRCHLECLLALLRSSRDEVVRMVLSAKLVKRPLESLQIEVEDLRKTEDFEIVHFWAK